MLIGLSPPKNVPQILNEQLLITGEHIADHVDMKVAHPNGQLLPFMQLHLSVQVVHVDLSGIRAAVWVDLQIYLAFFRQRQSAEPHGQWTDGGDGDALHGTFHEGTVEGHALAVGTHRSEEQQSISLELSDLDLLLIADTTQVQVENKDGRMQSPSNFNLADSFTHRLAVLMQTHLHLLLLGKVLCIHFSKHQLEDGVQVIGRVVVEDRCAAIGDAENGRAFHKVKTSAGFHQGLVLPHQEDEFHRSQSFAVRPLHNLHIFPLHLLLSNGCPAEQLEPILRPQQRVDPPQKQH